VLWTLSVPALRKAALGCAGSIFSNFFYRQFKAALLPGRIPVSWVDHALDEKIPFTPRWVGVYLDFVAFWVRILGFLRRHYRRRGIGPAAAFIGAMGKLYTFAGEAYRRHLSTTRRPRYLERPRFLLIHAADPHLMCIPSLHVMVVIFTYTRFREILRSLGDGERFAPQIEEVRRGALRISEAILYVKQHSVNCIAAAMYAMTRFEGELFPPAEAEDFASRLFLRDPLPRPEDGELVRSHITALYRRFLEAGTSVPGKRAPSWEAPLIDFLRNAPPRNNARTLVQRGIKQIPG
jgi:hypothetical protein